MNRRNFIQTTGISLASILIGDSISSFSSQKTRLLISLPDEVTATVNGQRIKLTGKGRKVWIFKNVIVNLRNTDYGIVVEIQAPGVNLSEVTLHWQTSDKALAVILKDQCERTYGDISWHKVNESEILPWYFMEHNNHNTNGFGVKTGANSFCFWKIGESRLSLTLDTCYGGNGIQLGDRKLQAAEIVIMKSESNESPFQATRRFTKIMCDKARIPKLLLLTPVTNPHLMERFGLHAAFKTGDLSSAVAAAGIARTHDLKKWDRLPDLKARP